MSTNRDFVRHFNCSTAICFAAIIAAFISVHCHAQWAGQIGDPRLPYFHNGNADELLERLSVSEVQISVLEAFIEDYQEERRQLSIKLSELKRKKGLVLSNPDELPLDERIIQIADIVEKILDLADKIRDLESTLDQDIKLTLETNQLDVFNQFLKERIRSRSTRVSGRYAEERIDLIELLSDLELDVNELEAISEPMNVYSLNLDELFRQRNDLVMSNLRKHYENRLKRLRGEKPEAASAEKVIEAVRTMSREEFLEYHRKMQEALAEDSIKKISKDMNNRQRIRTLTAIICIQPCLFCARSMLFN